MSQDPMRRYDHLLGGLSRQLRISSRVVIVHDDVGQFGIVYVCRDFASVPFQQNFGLFESEVSL
jgi:hypothetical protein